MDGGPARMNPNQLNALFRDAVSLHQQGRLAEADAAYAKVRKALPGSYDVLHLSGLVAHQLGRASEAVSLLAKAHRLNPTAGDCEARLGLALLASGKMPDAERHLRSAVARLPGFADAWEGLALCLKLTDRLEEAVACHRQSTGVDPARAASWASQGLTLALLGRLEEALLCHERALAIDPGYVPSLLGKAQALHQLLRDDEALAAYDRVLAVEPGQAEARSKRLFLLEHGDRMAPSELLAEHVEFGRRVGPEQERRFAADRSPGRKLRVGILSPDLRQHACAYFLEPILAHLDPAGFEVIAYADHFREDAVSARLRSRVALWRKTVSLSDAQLERTILDDQVDLLLDLAGHTAPNCRLGVLARRVAPVQVTYLGYPDTTGVKAIDYRITDGHADPSPGADLLATETLWRLPCAWTYQAPQEAPEPRLRVGPGRVYASFNFPGKWSERVLRSWARILELDREGTLVLKGSGLGDPGVAARLRRRLGDAGIDLARVNLLPPTAGIREHLECYHAVDVALDTFPYNGTTTTCEALWMGVPVVSLAGDRHASRVGSSLLAAVGRPEWIAPSTEAYAATAISLASDRPLLMRERSELRPRFKAGPLGDAAGFTRGLEAALRGMWGSYCARAADQGLRP
jgi:protein O-GlcNAc transferase